MGRSYSVDDDALVCNACSEELIGEQAAACLLTHRGLARVAMVPATVTPHHRRREGVCVMCGGRSAGLSYSPALHMGQPYDYINAPPLLKRASALRYSPRSLAVCLVPSVATSKQSPP